MRSNKLRVLQQPIKQESLCGAKEASRRKIVHDLLLAGVLLAIALFALLVWQLGAGAGTRAVVYVDGKEYASYGLQTDVSVRIPSADGSGENQLVIANGKAHIESATCPDGLCVQQGEIDRVGQTLVCLPNKVVVQIEN